MSTPDGSWFACDIMDVADCVRIWFRVNCMVSWAKSVSRIRLSASVRFVIMFPRFDTVASSRFMVEPMLDRSERTDARMVSMLEIADCAADCELTPPKDNPVERSVGVKLIVELLPLFAELIWKEKAVAVDSNCTPLYDVAVAMRVISEASAVYSWLCIRGRCWCRCRWPPGWPIRAFAGANP